MRIQTTGIDTTKVDPQDHELAAGERDYRRQVLEDTKWYDNEVEPPARTGSHPANFAD